MVPVDAADQAAVQPLGQPSGQPQEAVKVGAYQAQATRADTIATIESHALQGRQATTLYVRNIPVLTFLGSSLEAAASAQAAPQASFQSGAASGAEVKIASVQAASPEAATEPDKQILPDGAASARDPLWRATTAASRLNQLHRDNVAASDIKITWDTDRRQYLVKANEVEVVAFDADTVLPDTVEGKAGDLLQATNRIRRQMGNAAPLSSIEGDPNGFNQVSLGPVSLRISGYASWYGPGF